MALMKMTLLSFKSFKDPVDLLKPKLFVAMFNPASYKVEYNLTKDAKVVVGDGDTKTITAINQQKMSFDFLIDGTGANGEERIVLLETRKFEKIAIKVEGQEVKSLIPGTKKEHISLPQLLLLWGTFVFYCQIESYSVNYTLFNQLGIPLRATISATFIETDPPAGGLLESFNENVDIDTITNIAGFLSTAYSVTNNVAAAINMAREENLSSLRGKVTIR